MHFHSMGIIYSHDISQTKWKSWCLVEICDVPVIGVVSGVYVPYDISLHGAEELYTKDSTIGEVLDWDQTAGS